MAYLFHVLGQPLVLIQHVLLEGREFFVCVCRAGERGFCGVIHGEVGVGGLLADYVEVFCTLENASQ